MPWDKLLATLGVLLKALEPYVQGLAAFLAGRQWQRSQEALKDLERVEASNRAAAGVELLPDADVVRELNERSLYRVSGK